MLRRSAPWPGNAIDASTLGPVARQRKRCYDARQLTPFVCSVPRLHWARHVHRTCLTNRNIIENNCRAMEQHGTAMAEAAKRHKRPQQ
jgi:hypothetical protein